MHNIALKPLSPLGQSEPQIDEIGNVRIVEVIDTSFAVLSQRNGAGKPFNAAAKKAFKFPLPAVGMSTTKGDFTVFWSAPEQWFVEAPEATHEDIAAILKKDFKESASITEQSGGWCRFDIEGEESVSMLQRLCAVDTDAMAENAAIRSVIEHIGIFVLCRAEKQTFSIYAPRASADSLHHAFVTAAKSIA